MNQLLFLYPIIPFVEREGYSALRTFYTETLKVGVTGEEFDRRFGLINYLIGGYRDRGFQVHWGVFDEDLTSKLFDIKKEDRIVSVGISYFVHSQQMVYANEREVLGKLGSVNELVVGGFHCSDCVGRFVSAAKRMGIDARSDVFITDVFFKEMIAALGFEIDKIMEANGLLDSDEDIEEEKHNLFDGRLAGLI